MIRTNDTIIINAIGNDPDVRMMSRIGCIHTDDELDYSPWVDDPNNVVLLEEGFCAIFVWSAPFTYECHIMALPESRGSEGMRAGRLMLEYMKQAGAKVIWGRPSIHNRAAICYIRRMGLMEAGFGHHHVIGDVQYFMKGL